MNRTINAIRALDILDSRGNPTVRVFCALIDPSRQAEVDRLIEIEAELGGSAVFGR